MRPNSSVKFFPFSPGIPWNLKKGRYVVPEVPYQLLNSKLRDKNITTLSFGGLFESFYSLCVFEMLNNKMPGHNLFWSGNNEFQTLIHRQGLARISTDNLSEEDVDRFPVPLFFDKGSGAYFNFLNNYRNVYTYNRRLSYQDKKAATGQMLSNLLVDWDTRFFPRLRNHHTCPPELRAMLLTRSININKPFVLIIPGKSKYSNIDFDCLGWGVAQFKSIVGMLSHSQITPIVVSERGHIHLPNAKQIPLSLDFIIFLLMRAHAVISTSVDFPLISLGMPECKLISKKNNAEFSLQKNAKFLNSTNKILFNEEINPIDVWNFIANQ